MCCSAQAHARLYGEPPAALTQELTRLSNTCLCALAIGEDGLNAALAAGDDLPVVATFITAAGFHQIMQTYNGNRRVSALFAEADPLKNLALANILLGSKNAAVFYSDRGTYLQNVIGNNRLIKTSKETLAKNISNLDRVRAVVAVPDSSIWTKDTFRVSVMALYEQNKVVIGFSKNLVTAGALASLYFEDEDYLRDLKSLVALTTQNTSKPFLAYPSSYQIAINNQVAKSLDISIPASSVLLAEVNKAENK